GRKPRGRPKK
nr:Chain A, HIGH MOBILITY GROUP PROTEIN HMG-I/HMG-Y [Homo sapiens]2EZG_A Chain A, HIGH MOBILITY GROUP PROTEIN HMG-I/HMG-Y [Homo sapiens]